MLDPASEHASEAGAPETENEIEVTPEMRDAGAWVLSELDPYFITGEEICERIFAAMWQARTHCEALDAENPAERH
jgi:hypothetical protein